MADNPDLRYRDRFTVDFNDPAEVDYFMDGMSREFPQVEKSRLAEIVNECAREVRENHRSESRERIRECVRRKVEAP